MKKLTVLAAALVLTLGLAQCKKEQTPTNNATEGVFITLNVGGGASTSSTADGSRVIVVPDGHQDPDYATVGFEAGDVIYVGNNGSYCGYLEYDGQTNQFAGSVNPTSEADYLHFYFMGNKGGNAEPTSVCITDQTSKYPVISYAHSTALYNAGTTSYSARLLNHCAIVKFTTTDLPQTTDITITGMNNTVAVNFGTNNAATSATGDPYTFSSTGNGEITLHAESSTERWAILLPQGEVATATASAEGYATEGAFTVPAIAANDYKAEGIGVELVATAPAVPEGAIDGKFTINANNDQVYFSKGNLQYIGSAATPYWKFADNQWDYLGKTTGQNSANQNVDRDLFGWGTSNYNHGATCYQPWSTSTNNGQYNPYSSLSTHLYDDNGQADWGYNAISNGGNTENSGWRTLTQSEWDYVFNTRSTTNDIRYAKAQVAGVNGVILLPDDWSTSYYSLSSTNQSGASFTSNVISSSAWTNSLQSHGAVFLPAAGFRPGFFVYYTDAHGCYWTTSYGSNDSPEGVYFHDELSLSITSMYRRFVGHSIRLTCPAV